MQRKSSFFGKITKMKIISIVSIIYVIAFCEALPAISDGNAPDQLLVPEPQPAFNAERDVRFFVLTRLNPTNGQELIFRNLNSLRGTNFNGNRPTRVIIHGFQNDASSDVNILLTAAFLRNSDVNVIVGKKIMLVKCQQHT